MIEPLSAPSSARRPARRRGGLRVRLLDIARRAGMGVSIALTAAGSALHATPTAAAVYYVRQTVGDDGNDGASPATAWRSISKLSVAMHPGDTAYVGPGLYRDRVMVRHSGTAEQRLTFIADATGARTGDPPGRVVITGAEPVDERIFRPHGGGPVYAADFADFPVLGVVEMDGPQFRYQKARSTKEHLKDGLSELEVVTATPASYFYDEAAEVLYLHTTDGKAPSTHEIELMARGNGLYMVGKHYVTIVGFTFRHQGDAGINFFKGSGNGVAIGNTSYGSRQGIRVYDAVSVMVYGNTLFRNENCGVYFAAASTHGLAIANVAYENIKGVRWSSASAGGMALDNTLFDNRERGVAIESTDGVVVRGNTIVNNAESQLMAMRADYAADENCFQNGNADQLVADFIFTERFRTLAAYQEAKRQDLRSREGGCGPLPAKLDVQALHRETVGYAERARAELEKPTHPDHDRSPPAP